MRRAQPRTRVNFRSARKRASAKIAAGPREQVCKAPNSRKKIAAAPTSTPNSGKAPRYAKSRRGPSAQTGKGQKERHLVSVYPRAWFPWRKVSLQIDIAPRGCSAPTKSERSPEAGIATPRQSNPLCRCAPSAGEVNIILVVTSTLRVRNKVVAGLLLGAEKKARLHQKRSGLQSSTKL